MHIRSKKPTIAAFAIVCGICSFFKANAANATTATGITVESVSDYSYARAHGLSGYADTDANTEASGFLYGDGAIPGITTAFGSYYASPNWYTDSDVYDTDFLDADFSGSSFPSGRDYQNFDSSELAIAA